MAERVAELPLRNWIAPSWWGLWNGAGLFTDHPAGLLIPPAALGAAGIPAIQASYVWGIAYALLSLLLLGRMVAAIGGPREGRWALVLLQLMPVAFVFRIRANHEYPMLLCLLVALVGLDGVRRSWWWLPVVPLALTLALLIKGVFVLLVLLAAGLWVVTNPTHQPGAVSRAIVALVLSVGRRDRECPSHQRQAQCAACWTAQSAGHCRSGGGAAADVCRHTGHYRHRSAAGSG
jgi:4-amino-4-deoxy-L-arabinose transferase-like glycosyltransferase